MIKRIPLFLTILLCAVTALATTARADVTPPPQPRELIRQVLLSCSSESGEMNRQALSALYELDPSLGEKWERIMNLWETPVTVNGELPDGLAEDDTLCLTVLGFHLNADGTMRDELIGRLSVALEAF